MRRGIISGGSSEVSITGTPIAHIPLNGQPEFAGLAVDDDTAPIMTVLDGALVLSTDDRAVAVAHRDAWQQAIDNLDARAKADELRRNGPDPARPRLGTTAREHEGGAS
ncbi:hypothetical protein [Actinomadura sp. GTD37]|uniref:hypothetical protein n=1 Tax=Actinomadura sp. GTD37 TaxID=1778030 RepID=UPI0035BEEB8B